jgi:hypothetical protein
MNKYLDEDNDDTYDVDSYTERELFDILDLFNPSDRELEAKILLYIRKYEDIDTPDARKLLRFFHQIYQRFFEVESSSSSLEQQQQQQQQQNIDLLTRSHT